MIAEPVRRHRTADPIRLTGIVLAATVAALVPRASWPAPHAAWQAQFDAQGRFIPPADYRDWVFISSGANMSYTDEPAMEGVDLFDNTFVPKEALAVFRRTGRWPDKTVIMLETRVGKTASSINKRGLFQSGELMGLEAHVKDTARFKETKGWAFFGVGTGKPAKMSPPSAPCYSCHEQHGAVDTTFVQFYPTLLPIAQRQGTLEPGYLAETPAAPPTR